jgi:hypothetical protein
MIDNVYNDQTNERIIDPAIIDRELSPDPSQEEVKRRICEKDWVAYECCNDPIVTTTSEAVFFLFSFFFSGVKRQEGDDDNSLITPLTTNASTHSKKMGNYDSTH